jgi:DNA transposition AAA+ family ATPase
VAFACNTLDGIFLRANTCWTVTSMLAALMVELGQPMSRRRAPMMQDAVKVLTEHPRPIFIDESDYLFGRADMLDAMRDIYDVTGSPVILIGMEEFARKVQSKGKFARRITQWVEFCGICAEDARTLADSLCEVKVSDDLLIHVHKAARKNIGRMVTGLARIEQFARINALETVTRKEWADRPLFYDQPRFARRA